MTHFSSIFVLDLCLSIRKEICLDPSYNDLLNLSSFLLDLFQNSPKETAGDVHSCSCFMLVSIRSMFKMLFPLTS